MSKPTHDETAGGQRLLWNPFSGETRPAHELTLRNGYRVAIWGDRFDNLMIYTPGGRIHAGTNGSPEEVVIGQILHASALPTPEQPEPEPNWLAGWPDRSAIPAWEADA